MKCYKCNGKMQEGVNLIIHKDKTIPQRVKKCNVCGKAIVSADEYERVRKELHPSLLDRIKNLFRYESGTEVVDIFKGKVL